MEERRSKSTEGDDDDVGNTENIIINERDGLPNLHPTYKQLKLNCSKDDDNREDAASRTLDELMHDEDLPMSVIVTNVDPRVFKSDELKASCFILIPLSRSTGK